MTIFVGSFENTGTFYTTMTIIACTSIVITAVYILRLVGKILYGVPTNEHHLKLTDATAQKLEKLHIHTAWDLALHLPLRYEDETHITPIAAAPITLYAPSHPGSVAYRQLAREIVARGQCA